MRDALKITVALAPIVVFVATEDLSLLGLISFGGSSNLTIWEFVYSVTGLLYLVLSPILIYKYFKAKSAAPHIQKLRLAEVVSYVGSLALFFLLSDFLTRLSVTAELSVLGFAIAGLLLVLPTLPADFMLVSGYEISKMR
jgi:hypothetical protein